MGGWGRSTGGSRMENGEMDMRQIQHWRGTVREIVFQVVRF